MLRSLFILMLVALMAAVGLYYENDANQSRVSLEAETDHVLVAATAVMKVSEPEQASDLDCASPDLESLSRRESGTESPPAGDTRNCELDQDTTKP